MEDRKGDRFFLDLFFVIHTKAYIFLKKQVRKKNKIKNTYDTCNATVNILTYIFLIYFSMST